MQKNYILAKKAASQVSNCSLMTYGLIFCIVKHLFKEGLSHA